MTNLGVRLFLVPQKNSLVCGAIQLDVEIKVSNLRAKNH